MITLEDERPALTQHIRLGWLCVAEQTSFRLSVESPGNGDNLRVKKMADFVCNRVFRCFDCTIVHVNFAVEYSK